MHGFWRGFRKLLNAKLEPADAVRIPFLIVALILFSVPALLHHWKQKRAERLRRPKIIDLAAYRKKMEPKAEKSH